MENMDSQTQNQIWQRVFAPMQPPPREDLLPLLTQAVETMGASRMLAGMLQGTSRQLANRLYESLRENALCLRGICRLSGRSEGKFCTMPAEKEPAKRLLTTCYHRCRRAMAEYTARSADPEYGAVYQKMAQREGEHCCLIAQILGNLE